MSIFPYFREILERVSVSLQSRLPTASFSYIPDCQQSDCLQAIIAHI